jgi:hypothetical protein
VGGPGIKGSWQERRGAPPSVSAAWEELEPRFRAILARHPGIKASPARTQLGTLGGGNHFIEVCLDPEGAVWLMLHSGSRGVGNRLGSYFHRAGARARARRPAAVVRRAPRLARRGHTRLPRLRRGGRLGPGLRADEPAANAGRAGGLATRGAGRPGLLSYPTWPGIARPSPHSNMDSRGREVAC